MGGELGGEQAIRAGHTVPGGPGEYDDHAEHSSRTAETPVRRCQNSDPGCVVHVAIRSVLRVDPVSYRRYTIPLVE
ncbi:hypothetical protein GCM10010199_35010 [Dactylosporangium roseum]